MIPFHKHHNSEEVVIFQEGGATVTVGDKRAVAGPHSIVFIPRETWVSITNTGDKPIRGYYLFSLKVLSRETAAMHRKMMQEVSDFCLGNFADDATLVLISFLPSAKSLETMILDAAWVLPFRQL